MSQYEWEDGGDASDVNSLHPEDPVEVPRMISPPLRKKTIIEDDISTDSLLHHDLAQPVALLLKPQEQPKSAEADV